MTRRRLILFASIVLLAIGVGLILYGIVLPANFVAFSYILPPSLHTELNILVLVGIPFISIGIAFLLFWFFIRTKSANSSY